MNSVQIIGNLGGDPELNETRSGKSVCNLSVATNRKYSDGQGNTKEETTWFRVVVWGKQAENCARFLSKGRQVGVEGRLQTNEWEDNQGVKHRDKEIIAHSVHFLSGDNGGGRNGERKTEPSKGNPARNKQGGGSDGGWPDGGGEDGGWPDGDEAKDDPFDGDDIPF